MISYNSKTYAASLFSEKEIFNKYFFNIILKYLQPKERDKILEVGCSRGLIVDKLQKIGIDAYGIDINPESIKDGVADNLLVMDAVKLEFPDTSFDKIYSFHTIEHIPDLAKAFTEMSRVLKPGGKILLIYPMEPIRGLFALKSAILIYKNPFLARKIHIHKLNPKKLEKMAKEIGLEVVENRLPLFYVPQYLTVLRKN